MLEETVKPTIRVVVAVMEKNGRYLITQRRPTAVLPLLWEFPGGRVEPGEDDAEALKRELMHRVGVEIEVEELINSIRHPYDHYVVDLYLYACRRIVGTPAAKNVHAFRWVRSDQFEQYQFTPADQASMTELLHPGEPTRLH
jgi:8-oxo-dGTP diphosphatase